MLVKPASCTGCPLEYKGKGFVVPDGPQDSPLLFIGEAPGYQEASEGLPFVGPSGYKLNSLMKKAGLLRTDVRVHNILSCCPPGMELRGSSYEYESIKHCRQHLEPVLREGHPVIVAVGAIAAKNLLPPVFRKAKANDLHGTATWVDRGGWGYWVVPTYHPSFLLRGNQKLSGVVAFDISRAKAIAEGRWSYKPANLVVDPTIEWFTKWVDVFIDSCNKGLEPWITVDIETVGKMSKSEDELEREYDVIAIVRVNFAYNPDEGVTVPWIGPYKDQIRRILESKGVKLFWNWRFDINVLALAGYPVVRPWHDGMNMAKVLQSDLPQSLGFWASFYDGQAWKHLSESEPAVYGACDGYKTLRVGLGLAKDLQSAGQWEVYQRHIYDLDEIVLHPAEEIGLLVDREALAKFKLKLETKQVELEKVIQDATGEDAKPWVGKRKTPAEGYTEREVEEEVYVCVGPCGAVDVTAKHKCKLPKEPTRAKKPRGKTRAKKNPSSNPDSDPGLLDRNDSGTERP